MIKRIGMLTSGGDCQALNATMRGVVKGLSNSIDELEVYGFDDGYKGLIYGKYRMLTSKDFSGIVSHPDEKRKRDRSRPPLPGRLIYFKNPLTICSSASFSVRPRVISLMSCSPAILPMAASWTRLASTQLAVTSGMAATTP